MRGAASSKISATVPSVLHNEAPTARGDQAGVGEHARCHAASTCPRKDVASLPHQMRTRFGSVPNDAFCPPEVRALVGVANAPELGSKSSAGMSALIKSERM